MLVLTRRPTEAIRINHDVIIHVLEVRGEKVRLAIEAPTEIPVHREEVYQALKRRDEDGLYGDS
jgi:carbon storage regulator